MRNAKSILLAVLGLAGTAFGQATPTSIETLIQQNETVVGLGGMLSMNNLVVNDAKTWMVQISTSFPDTNRDGCLFSNGFAVLREGSPLSAPVGSTLDDWAGLSLNTHGDLGMIVKAKPATGLIIDGAYFNSVLVAKKDQVIDVPPFSAHAQDTDWEIIAVVKLNGINQLFLLGEVANPAVTRNRERALVRYQLDDTGNILDTTVLATEGMTIANMTLSGSACLGNNDHILGVSNRGDTITFIAQDSVQALVVNTQTIVAKSGTLAPNGRMWKTQGAFSLSRVWINDSGGYVLTGGIDPNNGFLIV